MPSRSARRRAACNSEIVISRQPLAPRRSRGNTRAGSMLRIERSERRDVVVCRLASTVRRMRVLEHDVDGALRAIDRDASVPRQIDRLRLSRRVSAMNTPSQPSPDGGTSRTYSIRFGNVPKKTCGLTLPSARSRQHVDHRSRRKVCVGVGVAVEPRCTPWRRSATSDMMPTGSSSRFRLMPHACIATNSRSADSRPKPTSSPSSSAIGIVSASACGTSMTISAADDRRRDALGDELLGVLHAADGA